MCTCVYNFYDCDCPFTSGVEDIVRLRPDLKDYSRPSDSLTALQLASIRDRYYVARHLALSVSFKASFAAVNLFAHALLAFCFFHIFHFLPALLLSLCTVYVYGYAKVLPIYSHG